MHSLVRPVGIKYCSGLLNRLEQTTRHTQRHFFASSATQQNTSLFVWGQVGTGSLGLGENEQDESTPIECTLPCSVQNIAFGTEHTAVVGGDGSLHMFGRDAYGQLGLGHNVSGFVESLSDRLASVMGQKEQQVFMSHVPMKIDGVSNVTRVSCGKKHTACVTSDGDLFTWGWGGGVTAVGPLGHGNKESHSTPKKVDALDGIKCVDVACGDLHTLVLTDEGRIFAMGEGEHGRLGVGGTSSCKNPVEVEFFAGPENRVDQIFCGKEYSFAITRDGVPFGWGRNDRQQMGQGGGLAMDVYSCDRLPVDVVMDERIIHMALSAADCVAVSETGEIYQWGDRQFLEPVPVFEDRFQDEKPNGKIVKVALGQSVMAFVTDQGELFTCNKNLGMSADSWALGLGSVDPDKTPRRVTALKDYFVRDVVAGETRMAAVVVHR